MSALSMARRIIAVRDVATESGGRRDYRRDDAKSAAAKRPLTIVEQAVGALNRRNEIRLRGRELEPARDARRQARPKAKTTDKPREPNRPLDERWRLLCPGEQGGFQSYAVWRKHLAAARALSGVDLTAHELRHVCVSIMYAAGVPERAIQEQIGHEIGSDLTARVYKHPVLVDRSVVSERISQQIAALTEAEAALGEYVAEPATTGGRDLSRFLDR